MLKFFRIASICLLILWMVMIFCLSAQTADVSSGTSGRFITVLVKIFNWKFDELPIEAQTEIIESFQFLVRKTAHFTIYFILGALSLLSVVTYRQIPFVLRAVIGGVISLGYSISDELHQTLVAGRSGEIRDVLIDFCGAALAIFLICIFIKLNKRLGVLCEKKGFTEDYRGAYGSA